MNRGIGRLVLVFPNDFPGGIDIPGIGKRTARKLNASGDSTVFQQIAARGIVFQAHDFSAAGGVVKAFTVAQVRRYPWIPP